MNALFLTETVHLRCNVAFHSCQRVGFNSRRVLHLNETRVLNSPDSVEDKTSVRISHADTNIEQPTSGKRVGSDLKTRRRQYSNVPAHAHLHSCMKIGRSILGHPFQRWCFETFE